jgi:hypothetical protein
MPNYDASLSAQHISTNLRNYEAARSGFFTFIVDDIDNIIRADYVGDRSDEDSIGKSSRIEKAQESLKLNVTSASVPHFSIEPLQYKRGNDVVKFAGTPTFDAGTISVDDVVGLDTKSILMAWQALAYDVKTRRGGRMVDYKKNCTLVEYTQDFQQIRSWKMYGCWVSDIGDEAFDKESDGKRKLTATIQYDRAEMILPNEQ